MASPNVPNVPNTAQRKRGYRRLAEYMAWDPATAIFPRFQVANLHNLLLMQAQISELEEQLNDTIDADDQSNGENRNYSSNWSTLRQEGAESPQWETYQALRKILAEYNQALVHQIILNKQGSPHPHDLEMLQKWLVHVHGGDSQLRGPGSLTWLPVDLGGRPSSDHLTISPTDIRADIISVFGRRYLGPVMKWIPFSTKKPFLPEEGADDFQMYSSAESLYLFGNNVISFVAATLILLPVIVLHFLHDTNWRLAVIVIFSLIFTATLTFATSADRAQIFAATAAFIAVQVVYVGTAVNSPS